MPHLVLTNEALSQLVDTNDEWIASRTGIRERRVVSGGETLTRLAADAVTSALAHAGLSPAAVDVLLLCTSSPEDAFGGACLLQAASGCANALAFDLTAACSGFVVGLVTAAQFIRSGGARTVVVVGADALSRYVDWTDRSTCILFGDGAGAVVLTTADEGAPCALLGWDARSDGGGARHLTASAVPPPGAKPLGAPGEPSGRACFANIGMAGGEVFKFAVRTVPLSLAASLAAARLDASRVDALVMHQANQRILDAVAARLSIPHAKVVSNLSRFGNTSAASIPLALDGAIKSGAVAPGHVVATAGFGAGLTWASAVLRYDGPQR